MRPLEFRAIDAETKEWIFGVPLPDTPDVMAVSDCQGPFYDILPETLGQFTGFTDKNGKKIYEGDILESVQQPPVWLLVSFGITDDERVGFKMNQYGFDINCPKKMFISGNIHENPELLAGFTDYHMEVPNDRQ